MRALVTIAAVVAGLASAGPATAWQRPHVRHMTLAVELTGLHVVDWHVQDPAYPDPARAWVQGSGTQTLGFSMRRPLRLSATAISGTTPSGDRLPPLVLARRGTPRPLKGSLRRTATWHVHDADGCDREGGCEDGDIVVPIHPRPSCPAGRVAVPVDVDVAPPIGRPDGHEVFALVRGPLAIEGLWPNCPPDTEGVSRPLALAQPPSLMFPGALERIARMRRGSTLTFRRQVRMGAADGVATRTCPRLSGPGQQECSVTDLTLQVRRLR